MKLSRNGSRYTVYAPDQPGANNSGYVLHARYVMVKKLGRPLSSDECVHHINGNATDDRPENLAVERRGDHTARHWRQGDLSVPRRLDYGEIVRLMADGLGYRKIATALGEPLYSVRYACRTLRKSGTRG